uniref:Uncharacterized protein n=1 Tax=Arthrobotrys musiformis TaxID=47236 RepID=A0A482EAV3_9PEZI|nr:hypothetical protein [Arthrobotrys musiformis]
MSWEDFNLIYKNKTNIFKFDKSYNLLSNFIFIVSDKDIFINHLKNNLDIDINQGNSKTRGKIIRIKFRLANLDLNFRNSMYKHNCYFSEKDSNIEYLSKACFSFNNIYTAPLGAGSEDQNLTNNIYLSWNLNNINIMIILSLKIILSKFN